MRCPKGKVPSNTSRADSKLLEELTRNQRRCNVALANLPLLFLLKGSQTRILRYYLRLCTKNTFACYHIATSLGAEGKIFSSFCAIPQKIKQNPKLHSVVSFACFFVSPKSHPRFCVANYRLQFFCSICLSLLYKRIDITRKYNNTARLGRITHTAAFKAASTGRPTSVLLWGNACAHARV